MHDAGIRIRTDLITRWYSRMPILMPGAVTRLGSRSHVALTFDDGPHSVATPRTLAALERHALRAVFFCTGRHVTTHPDLAHHCHAQGHSVQIHGWNHDAMAGKSGETIRAELRRAIDAVHQATGARPRYFRPPYGRWNPMHAGILRELGLTLVLWNRMPREYDRRIPSSEVAGWLASNLAGGDILVLHDNQKTADSIGGIVQDVAGILQRNGLATTTALE
jgi:peptidoglycan-N-acetylglucosamine deacetylase